MGFPHPDYLLPFLSAGQLLDWQQYAAQVGLGEARNDIHWGMLLSMFYNANRGSSAPAKPATDFMPYYKDEPETAADFAARIKAILGVHKCPEPPQTSI